MRARRALASVAPSLIVLTLAAAPSCSGGEDPVLTESASLRAAFPEQAARVLESGAAFVASTAGFARARGTDAFAVELPREAADAVIFRAATGQTVAVREAGLVGPGTVSEGAVAYRRAGGTSFWTAAPYGVEEWLHLGAGAARRGVVAATWTIEGATTRQHDDAVELVDDRGAALLVVTAPAAYAAGGRAVGVRLEARGARIDLFVDVDGEAVLVDPQWTTTGPLSVGRSGHIAALLGTGKVLVTGGAVTKVAELYDPVAGTFTSTGSMAFGRLNLAGAALLDGHVLVTGGALGNSAPTACELYDPAADTFSPTTGPMSTPRQNHTATLLPGGKVLIAGGFPPFTTNSALPSAELYDPATGTFSPTGSMSVPRGSHTATPLAGGAVLIVGGSTPGATVPVAVAGAEIYDPTAGTFTTVNPMGTARTRHAAAPLKTGKVLVVGGKDATNFATAEIYDPGTGNWTATGTLAYPRFNHTATLLGSGGVLAVGGSGNGPPQVPGAISELFDPATGVWSFAGSLSTAHIAATATVLPGGAALIAGGGTATSELYASQSANGSLCSVGGECVSGFCADGVCCSTACDAGACDACSVAKGALQDGICYPLSGVPCDDGDACTQGDTCMAGTCAGGNPTLCTILDACHTLGSCNPATGVCDNPKKPEGSLCDDGDLCTQGDTCSGGACVSGPAVTCVAPDACHIAGVCNPTTGVCFHAKKLDGAACDDSNACTQVDTCQAGVCVGGNIKECPPLGPCHTNTCAPGTGVCGDVVAADGAPCSTGDLCSPGGACQAGACIAGTPVVCKADACHNAGTCDPATGVCDNPVFPDGASCPGGTCVNGICTAGTGGTGGASASGSTSASGGGGGTGGGETGAKPGCGCEAAGTGGDSGRWGALALLVIAAARRRRSMTRVGG
jgi:MYXO-CTERM domain-containing protein